MSQRRGAPQKETANPEMVPFSQVLDKPSGGMRKSMEPMETTRPNPNPSNVTTTATPASLDERYESEAHNLKLKHWKEGPFATGMTAPTWEEEYSRYTNPRECCMHIEEDSMGCLCFSAIACSKLGASRVGNMAVLKQSTEWVEEEEEDENGETKTRRFTRPRLDVVVGPYWPMLCCVTYPLILGVSAMTLITAIPGKHPVVILVWACCTIGLIYSLAMTAFRDPGILPRYEKPPPSGENNGWRWSDRAHSYRPRGAFYDPDTAVIVEGFDHTCPWTGTAIGSRNMLSFQCFVGLVFICLMIDIVLLTGGFP